MLNSLHFGQGRILYKFSVILLKVGVVYRLWIDEYDVEAHMPKMVGSLEVKTVHNFIWKMATWGIPGFAVSP